jgi:Cu-Zn family superoxide dismutase
MVSKGIGIFLGTIFMLFVVIAGYAYNAMSEGSYTSKIIDNEGNKIGTVSMNETDAGVLMLVNITGLKPKSEHAMHVHEKADCSPKDSFKNAGGHYNPYTKSHGMMHPDGHHAGDMPNLRADEFGNIEVTVLNQDITLQKPEKHRQGYVEHFEKRASLFDEDGSALIIHADPDDHVSQPSGAAGNRIGCAEID